MSRRATLLSLWISVVIGCSSTPSPVDETPPADTAQNVSLEEESKIIEQSRTNIAIGSPDSLISAIDDLAASDVKDSEIGRELIYIAQKILFIAYPLIETPAVEVLPPPTDSIYPALFDEVENGRYPRVTGEEATFITLLVPTLALLRGESADVVEASVNALDQVLSFNSGSVLAQFLRGYSEELLRNMDAARSRYSEATVLSESCYPAFWGMARIDIEKEDYDSARDILAKLSEKLPSDPQILGLLARATFLSGDPEAAEPLVFEALALSRQNLDLFLLRAQILEALGDDRNAGNLLTIVESDRPDDIEVLLLRAKLLEKEERYEEALIVVQRGAGLYPDNLDFSKDLGRLLIRTGRAEEGRTQLEQTLEKEPDKIESLELLLIDTITKQEWPAAAGYVERILRIANDAKYLRSAIVVYMAMSDFETAADYADELYAVDPDSVDSALPVSRALIAVGEMERARGILTDAVENSTDALEKSEIYYLRSFTAQSLAEKGEDLQQSLLQNPQNVVALIDYSDFFEEAGDIKRAHRWLRQAVILRPEDEQLQKKLDELAQQLGGN